MENMCQENYRYSIKFALMLQLKSICEVVLYTRRKEVKCYLQIPLCPLVHRSRCPLTYHVPGNTIDTIEKKKFVISTLFPKPLVRTRVSGDTASESA